MSLSLSRPPRLLLSFSPCGDNRLMFFSSCDQSLNLSSPTTMVATKNNTLTMSKVGSEDFIRQNNSVRGFLCCFLERRYVVCNPNTRQVIVIPQDYNPVSYKQVYMYLGYGHTNDQYKVLRLKMKTCSTSPILHSLWTLGGSSSSWRHIESSIIYYHCEYNGVYGKYMVVSRFDVASEQIHPVKTPESMVAHLTNYRGKLAAYDFSDDDRFILWVLDDAKNQVWSKRACVFSSVTHSLLLDIHMHFAGISATGEIVYVPWTSSSDPFELFFYDVEKKVERLVRIEGLGGDIYGGATCYASVSCSFVDNIFYL